ncbi:hypodermin-A-like isoform X1 [Cydia pomonella]|uniref:hypodermin-A-like isoform X1 n=2 Tax=Cydia pomonella TaxID=82600 RepID=UPI002ADDF232|nr:hypodermin-A-like isoform X1 [Cydia pomonella]
MLKSSQYSQYQFNMLRRFLNYFVGLMVIISYGDIECGTILTKVQPSEQECEFPPKFEEDLTHLRRKRLTTENGLVCLEDYPYTVSVRLHSKHWCGGALVGKEWVLTAAQCFDYVTKDEVSVRTGSVFRDFGGKIFAVTEITRHPEYRIDQYYPEHNLALIKLNMQVTLGNRVQPVALAAPSAEVPPNYGHVVVTGYGSISGQIREGQNQELRRMIVQDVPRASCRLLYGNGYRLQSDHMCLQSTVKGIALCAGDTGDPAVHFSGASKGGTLYGIALFSGTEECTYKSKPGVYAKISHSRVWLDSILKAIPINSVPADSADSSDNDVMQESE